MTTRWLANSAAIAAAALILLHASAARALTEGGICDFVRQQAAQKYQVSPKDVDVKWKGASLATIASDLPASATVRLGSVYMLSGTLPVPLDVLSKGKLVRTIFPELSIDVWEKVLVTTDRIPMGSPVASSQVQTERRTLASLGVPPLTSLDGLADAVAVRDIPPQTVLIPAYFNVPPLVRSGSVINVSLVSGGLTILTTGQALQDGRKGQAIRVLNMSSHRDFTGVVTGQDQVTVQVEGDEQP